MINELKRLKKESYEKYVLMSGELAVANEIEFLVEPNPTVSIILAVYNQYEYTMRCLTSIFKYIQNTSYEIILIDDCSQDKTRNIEDRVGNIQVIHHDSNQGYIRSCNDGVSIAKGKYIYLLNNDTQLVGDAVTPLVHILDENNKVGAVGSKLVYSDGTLQNAGCKIINGEVIQIGENKEPLLPRYNDIDDTIDFLCGASFMMPRLLWNEIGGYDTRFGLGYSEDVDLCFEIKKRGYDLVYVPESEIIHFKGKSFGSKSKSLIKENKEKLKQKWEGLPSLGRKKVIWGAGKKLRDYYNPKWEAAYIVDNNSDLWGKEVLGLTVFSPDSLHDETYVTVIICTDYYREIIAQIYSMKLTNIEVLLPEMINETFQYNRNYFGFSVFVEDAMLNSYINFYGKKSIKHYIDVGTNHPVYGNATIKFYLDGASGCLVEPNPEYEQLLNTIRPRDQVMICGCASIEEEGDKLSYYEINGVDTRNTFSESVADEYLQNGYEVTKKNIPVHSLNYIIDMYNKKIDYISIDVEGLEYRILKDFSFKKYRIQYFNIEKSEGPIVELLESNGYRILAETPSNWIFERK